MRRIGRRTWLPSILALLAVGISACGAPADSPNLGVSNDTTLIVTIVVNGHRVATLAPGGADPSIDAAGLPALPWTVEAQSPSGRVLTSMQVFPGQVKSTTNSDLMSSSQGTIGRVDLTCGRLTIWAGDRAPSGGPRPAFSLGTAGDCVP